MDRVLDETQTRRGLLKSALLLAGGATLAGCTERVTKVAALQPVPGPQPLPAPPIVAAPPPPPIPFPARTAAAWTRPPVPQGVRTELYGRALAALNQHADRIQAHDRIAVADFTSDSTQPRFHVIEIATGQVQSFLVAHGSGSDPEHTGLLQRFSNYMGSNATSEGAFLAADYYIGQHGRSQRLFGLDPTNSNAYERAIVVHSAWYANPAMVATHGKLGRSQGCFAVGEQALDQVFAGLGQGRMIYASKV